MSVLLERRLPPGTTARALERIFPTVERHPYADDPIGYCRDVLGFAPWSKQREILEAVRGHRRVAVRSCHGVGKTAAAAAAVLWFHDTHPESRVVSTAPTWEPGVKDLLWREIRALHARAQGRVASQILDTRLERGEKWFAQGYSTDKPERFSGHHAADLLLVVDEASGVDDQIFEAAEGFLTSENAMVLLIGNPTQTAGQFYRAFHAERADWARIHISAFDAPCFTGEAVSDQARRNLITERWVEDRRRMWGDESPAWQVRVLGDFPTSSDDTVCPLGQVEAAQKRDLPAGENAVIACDVARFGSDETVIAVRRGPKVRVAAAYVGRDLMQTVGAITVEARRQRADTHAVPRIVIDDSGVGGGVTDRLRELGQTDPALGRVEAFTAGAQALSPDDYPNRRSELWFAFAERLPELDLDTDEQLAADLVAPRYRLDSPGRRVVEKKAATKKRLGRSPDRADGVLLTLAPPAGRAQVVAQPTTPSWDQIAAAPSTERTLSARKDLVW